MFSMLGILRPNKLKVMVEGVRKSRALKESQMINLYTLKTFHITKLLDKKLKILNVFISTKEKAVFLKSSSKLEVKRKCQQKYELQFKSFGKEGQNNFEENDEIN